VAQLAGVPKIVIAQAKKKLVSMEKHSRQPPQVGQTLALNFDNAAPFVVENVVHEVVKDPRAEQLKAALQAIEPDELSPRQALDELYRLRKLLK
jgi:DNA mismatch repair protein MutS